MGITEYVSSSHTFGVLVCAKNDDLCAAAARRIQRNAPQYCGLYTYNSMSPAEVDPLYVFVTRQYRAILWLRTGADAVPVIHGLAVGGLPHYGARVVTSSPTETETTVFIPHAILDSAETRNEFADYVATALQGVS